jgi:hypothetical protein
MGQDAGEESKQQDRRIEEQGRELLLAEKRTRRLINVTDLMAVLMVAATAFSALAAWRTAQVAQLIFAVSDRPFIGVQQVAFERADTEQPAIVVDFRNFGAIAAEGAIVKVQALLDGKPVPPRDGEMTMSDQGIVSPDVPHFFYVFLLSEEYKKVLAGASRLMVQVTVKYKGPEQRRQYCYFEKLFYDSYSASFRHAGGTDRCGSHDVF